MQRLKYMAIILAAALLFSACASVEPRSSQEQGPAASPVVLPVLRQVTDLTEPLRKAIEDGTVLEFLQLHDNIAFEDEDETLGLDVVERFYQNFLDNVPDEIYIGRKGRPLPVIYHLLFGSGDSYWLSLTDEKGTQRLCLSEIVQTDNEYIFTTDSAVSDRAVEVGINGEKGLTIRQLCDHTWQHEIDDRLVALVGRDAYIEWRNANDSRVSCTRNLFTFLKHFQISYDTFMKVCGDEIEDSQHLLEIEEQVYPERLQPQKVEPEPPAAQEQKPEPEEPQEEKSQEVPVVTGSHFLGEVEQGIIDAINEERRSLGLNELQYDERLRSAARIRSRELYRSGVWAHTRPKGDPWQTVLKEDIPVAYHSAGENLANVEYNDPRVELHTDPEWWFEEWKSSPGHYENICRPEFTHIGAGLYWIEREDGMIVAYATTIFIKME